MFSFHLSPPEGSTILVTVGAIATGIQNLTFSNYGKNCIALCSFFGGPTKLLGSTWPNELATATAIDMPGARNRDRFVFC
jgi:hypothetical protein